MLKIAQMMQRLGFALMALLAGVSPALAAEPKPWQLGFQEPASLVKIRIDDFHDFLLVVITLITIFVLALMAYICVKFRKSANPTPSKTTHNTTLEVLWTVIPVVILVVIAVPSFKLLYYGDRTPNPEMTLKVVGHQWYWSYEYPDLGEVKFDSNIIADKDLKPGQKRLLEVDQPVVLPINTNVRVQFASTDVMHSWFLPALGIQVYTTPGRLNEGWVNITKEGTYYGQCNQICGVNHGFMPIKIQALSKDAYAKWAEEAKKKFVQAPASTNVAQLPQR
ncbi:MAG: cytochrome c oxidase subunit II [Alphaproteobacteria bacterium]|nr:cytochrome c oxidase subunit II [Alphaproteobacteria bacterium]